MFIQKSKNDQDRHGHTVLLGKAKNQGVCPINWFKLFLLVCDRGADKLFHQKGKKQGLAPASVNPILKRLLDAAHIQDVDIDLLTSHSCRIGGATAAAAAGVNLRLIMRHGNWRSYSVFLYIRDSMADRLSVSQSIPWTLSAQPFLFGRGLVVGVWLGWSDGGARCRRLLLLS